MTAKWGPFRFGRAARWPSLLAILLFAFFPLSGLAAPPDIWPLAVPTLSDVSLQQQCGIIDARLADFPPGLKPAARFQKTFLRILSGAPESLFMDELQRFIAADGTDPTGNIGETGPPNTPPGAKPLSNGTAVAHALAEISRTWLARCEMRQIDGFLRGYYRKHVAFPEQFSVIEPDLPETLRHDPWGNPWNYSTHAPTGFAKFTTQRYRLGPKRFPELSTLAEAAGSRNPPAPPWKIVVRKLGEGKALEFRTNAAVVTIQPGGKIDGFTLLAFGADWALMAGADQLFTVPF